MVKQIRKRIMAVIMTLALVISLMPVLTPPARAAEVTIALDAEPNTPLPMNLHELSGVADLNPYTNGGTFYSQTYSQPNSGANTAQLYTDTPGDIAYGSILADDLDNNYTVYFLATQTGAYTFTITLEDDYLNSTVLSFTVDVNFANAAPTVTTPDTISYTDTADTFTNTTGTISASDSDGTIASYGISGGTTGGGTLIGAVTYDVSQAGTYGMLYLKSSTGEYVFDPNDTAINAVSANQSETFTVTATDDLGATGNATLMVSITGVNDAPTLSATATNPTYTENGSAVALFSGASVSTVESGQTISGLTMTVSNLTDTKEFFP